MIKLRVYERISAHFDHFDCVFCGWRNTFLFFFLFYLKKNEINITATRPDRYEKIKQSKNAERYTEQAWNRAENGEKAKSGP